MDIDAIKAKKESFGKEVKLRYKKGIGSLQRKDRKDKSKVVKKWKAGMEAVVGKEEANDLLLRFSKRFIILDKDFVKEEEKEASSKVAPKKGVAGK